MEDDKGGKIVLIRQMLSARDITDEIGDVVQAAVELEAARSQRMQESPWNDPIITYMKSKEIVDEENSTDTFSQQNEDSDVGKVDIKIQYIHPSSIESALSSVC